MRRTISFVLLTGLILFSASCRQSDSDAKVEPSIPVEVMTVSLGEVVQTLNYYGDIKAENEVKVFSKIPDRIEKFFVDAGDRVSKGAPIAQIVATTIEQAVRQAEAALVAVRTQEANLQVEYERVARLYREQSISKQQYDAIETQYKATQAQAQQAEAALASARSQLRDATVTAPIAGIIGKRYYEAGDMATPTLPLVSVVQMDRVKITFGATEQDLAKLALGQKAVVHVKPYPDRDFTGTVAKISPVLDPLTRMAEIEVLLDNPGHLLKPGMYAQAQITTGILKDVLVVPRYAVIENTSLERVGGKDIVSKNYYVFVVAGGKAVQRKLEVIYLNHEYLAVSSGIAIGEKLVIVGQNNLREGMPVTIVREEVSAS
ncbi:MAG: efflux RND transporter periplasmic adaptor subunit [candidate division KSB1 bacterium]|nr:efflux RND transporter periplasmic adaptor subunit [candidate division KSB1 bacterium]MDZ7303024.1 efflux RND transporter periplasmic adaptor subunit [candidate division KSB1 bacterium]MDZ7312468.1 efflux RND transporter periplasmic adaptor subunit [candidate division KSB1 bacterium]